MYLIFFCICPSFSWFTKRSSVNFSFPGYPPLPRPSLKSPIAPLYLPCRSSCSPFIFFLRTRMQEPLLLSFFMSTFADSSSWRSWVVFNLELFKLFFPDQVTNTCKDKNEAPVDPQGKRDAITKIIVNKRTDAWKIDVILSSTITNCSVLVFEAICYFAHCFLKKGAGCMITKYTLRRHNRLWLLLPFMTEVSVERLTPALAGFLDAADTNCSCDWMLSNQNKLKENCRHF